MRCSIIAILFFFSYNCLAETTLVDRFSSEDETPVVSFIDTDPTWVNLSKGGSCVIKHWPCIELEKITTNESDTWELPERKVIDMTNNPDFEGLLVYRQRVDENGNFIRREDEF